MPTLVDYQFYLNLTSYIAFAVLTMWFFYDKYIRRYIQIHILKEKDNIYYVIHSKKLKMQIMKYNYQSRTYAVQLEKMIIDKRNRPIIYYELENTLPISFNIIKEKLNDSGILHKILKHKRVEDLVGNPREKEYIIIIIILIIALIAISVYSIYRIGEMNTQLQTLIQQIKGITG